MVELPISPMLAAASDTIPAGMMYEPKWDGWRCVISLRDGTPRLFSRRGVEITHDFPELVQACHDSLPADCIVDGEIIMIRDNRLEYSQLAKRHGAGDTDRLATMLPASFIVFDVLEVAGRDICQQPQHIRRMLLEEICADIAPPLFLTPMTEDLATAQKWFVGLENFGLDGVIARPKHQTYQQGARALIKIKHRRTGDLAVGGFRLDRTTAQGHPSLGAIYLGAFTDTDLGPQLHFLGVCSGFPQATRHEMADMLQGLAVARSTPQWRAHPWHISQTRVRIPEGVHARGLDEVHLIDPLLVCEVSFDAMHPDPTGVRFRSNARFLRWRIDKAPEDCLLAELEGQATSPSPGSVHSVPDLVTAARDQPTTSTVSFLDWLLDTHHRLD